MPYKRYSELDNDGLASKFPPEWLPILIIPGFMSSGLEIQESKLRPSWEGKRIWLNLSTLGFSAIYFGSAQHKGKSKDDGIDSSEENEQEKYKSCWLEHMRLNPDDLRTENTGVKIRPISGLEGVDYLTPGAFTSPVTYVFGPVIAALREAGYKTGINLQAAPYDWRLPPSELEKRDSYFTRTLHQVEDLYYRNHSTPVVILGHSLGTKTAHYFLNFCLHQRGQAWLDKHVHTYLPIGAPHLGAPKALRSIIAGDKMSLDAFLDDEEALILGRSFGSGPWLLPEVLPEGVPSTVYVLPHGVLEIEVNSPLNTNSLVQHRRAISRPNYYRLVVTHGNNNQQKVGTPFHRITCNGQDVVVFDDKISFATDVNPHPRDEQFIRCFLQEPGIKAAKYEKKQSEKKPFNCCCCILRFCCCFWICEFIYHLIRLFVCCVFHVGVVSADAITKGVGGGTNLAFSDEIAVPPQVWKGKTVLLQIPLYHQDDYRKTTRCCCRIMRQRRTINLHIKMKWQPYKKEKSSSFGRICSPICLPSTENKPLKITKKRQRYQEFPGYDIMEREGLKKILKMIKDVYDADTKIGPRSISSYDPPPVKRVHAIYGINLPTEVGAVYKRRDTCLSPGKLKNFYGVDYKAKIQTEKRGYTVKAGLLLETSQTPQTVSGGRKVSGDGTVPFWSLQHCKTWKRPDFDVTVVELEGAEHREILSDSRLHQELLRYCRLKKESV